MVPMGYRGKTAEQRRARELRVEGWTLEEIAAELGVSKGSVSTWVRDVDVDPDVWAVRAETRRNHGWAKRRDTFLAKQAAEAAADLESAQSWLGPLSDRDLFVAGIALYAGEGSKGRGSVQFPNSDPRIIVVFLAWLRRFFDVDESRLRVWLYLHENLDLSMAIEYWSTLAGIPPSQFGKPYRAEPDPSIREAKHPLGCPAIRYSCTATQRRVMALVGALLSSSVPVRGSSIGRAVDC